MKSKKKLRSSLLQLSKVGGARISAAAVPSSEGLPRKIHERRRPPPIPDGEMVGDPDPSGPVCVNRDEKA